MGDLKASETLQDAIIITDAVTGLPTDGLLANVSCNMIRVSNGAITALTVQAVGAGTGAYRVTDFTNAAAGMWMTSWAIAVPGFVINYPFKLFWVSGGYVTDLYTDTQALLTRLTALRAGYLDNLSAGAVAQAATALSTAQWTNARAGYLDNLSVGAVAQAATALTSATWTNARAGYLDNLSAGAAALAATALSTATWTAARGGYLDNINQAGLLQVTAARGGYLDRIANHLITRTWFSPSQISVTAVGGAGGTVSLPTVTLPNIAGTIVSVYAGFKFRMIENTNAAANKLNGAQTIQIQRAAEGWATCINFVDDQFSVAITTREGGDCIIGNVDVVATVAAFNDTYEFQWTTAKADQNNLVFNDVQTFLIVSYY